MKNYKEIEFEKGLPEIDYVIGGVEQKTNKVFMFPLKFLDAHEWNKLEDGSKSWVEKFEFLTKKNYIKVSALDDNATVVWEKLPMNIVMSLFVQYSKFFLDIEESASKIKVLN